MKNQLASFIRWLVAAIYSLLNNPLKVRIVATAVVLALVVLALVIPALTTFAAATGGTGH